MSMTIETPIITIGELYNGYEDLGEDGVTAYGKNLNVRPPYQREFVYNDVQQLKVINSVYHGFPLNTMYWADNGEEASPRYEIIDGQQRTISLCRYIAGKFMYEGFYFEQLKEKDPNKAQQILDYKLSVYVCSGSDAERLDWFETVNLAGVELTEQELRNSVYTGTWLSSAKKDFSKTGCGASQIAKPYCTGSPIRQELLETAIKWHCTALGRGTSNKELRAYMADAKKSEKDDGRLWEHFQKVINWVKGKFPQYRSIMKGIDWGSLYATYKDDEQNPNSLEAAIKELLIDDSVTNKKGIYEYLLTGKDKESRNEKYLSIRTFSTEMKMAAYEAQGHKCKKCGKECTLEEMEGDHITPWVKGGKTVADNCQMLCIACNRAKSDK